jgi:(S)-2-hydroxyglutarate dehydrogenase
MSDPADYLIVGGGLVGLATALQILRQHPQAGVRVLEKEDSCGLHQSTRNSGVLHCGLYYKPGSLKARLAVEGIRSMTDFCREHGIPHEICGKVLVATDAAEEQRLRQLAERGRANGLGGLQWLTADELREREPSARGVAALLVPQEGIVDYAAVITALHGQITARGGEVRCGAKVTALHETAEGWTAETPAGEFSGGFLVNCAGLYCDHVARLGGLRPRTRIIPFRGDYYKLKPGAGVTINHLIYPVPDPSFPFLGVHFTRLVGGGVEAGPSAVLATAREGYSVWTIHPGEFAAALAFPGLWKFLARHPAMSALEFARSLSSTLFLKALQKLVPGIRVGDIEKGPAGVRAQAMEPDGTLQQDFSLLPGPRSLHVLNAPSPAATASLAIGEYIAARVA